MESVYVTIHYVYRTSCDCVGICYQIFSHFILALRASYSRLNNLLKFWVLNLHHTVISLKKYSEIIINGCNSVIESIVFIVK